MIDTNLIRSYLAVLAGLLQKSTWFNRYAYNVYLAVACLPRIALLQLCLSLLLQYRNTSSIYQVCMYSVRITSPITFTHETLLLTYYTTGLCRLSSSRSSKPIIWMIDNTSGYCSKIPLLSRLTTERNAICHGTYAVNADPTFRALLDGELV